MAAASSKDGSAFKLVLLGDVNVGKTSLALRYVQSQFQEVIPPTVGVSFQIKTVNLPDGRSMCLEMWDTAGQERFMALGKMFYRGAHAAIITFDVTKPETFPRALSYIDSLKEYAHDKVVIGLAGNKCDQPHDEDIVEKAKETAKKENLVFFLTSAKSGQNVSELFEEVVSKIPVSEAVDLSAGSRRSTVSIAPDPVKKEGGCPC